MKRLRRIEITAFRRRLTVASVDEPHGGSGEQISQTIKDMVGAGLAPSEGLNQAASHFAGAEATPSLGTEAGTTGGGETARLALLGLMRDRGAAWGCGTAVYLVEGELPGVTLEQFAAARQVAVEAGRQLTADGKTIRYLRSTFVPDESRCVCLFEAANPEVVNELNDAARLPFTRIVKACDLTP